MGREGGKEGGREGASLKIFKRTRADCKIDKWRLLDELTVARARFVAFKIIRRDAAKIAQIFTHPALCFKATGHIAPGATHTLVDVRLVRESMVARDYVQSRSKLATHEHNTVRENARRCSLLVADELAVVLRRPEVALLRGRVMRAKMSRTLDGCRGDFLRLRSRRCCCRHRITDHRRIISSRLTTRIANDRSLADARLSRTAGMTNTRARVVRADDKYTPKNVL